MSVPEGSPTHDDDADPRIVRAPADVAYLHDVLHAAMAAIEAGRLDLGADGRENAHGMVNLCCWLLGHPEGAAIDEVLEGLPLLLADAGVTVRQRTVRTSVRPLDRYGKVDA